MDFRFTDTKGKMQHVTADVELRRRRRVHRRIRLRRLLDRRLEGDRSLRHDADARPGHRPISTRSSRRRPSRMFCDVLEPDDRPALRARPALDRQEGRSLYEVARHRRHSLLRPGSRVLHLRRRAFIDRPVRHRLSRSTPAELPIEHRHRSTRRATWATARAPRAATSLCPRSTAPRTCAPRCCR